MNTLILDIGCSRTKFSLYNDETRVDKIVLKTPDVPNKNMIDDIKKVFAERIYPKKVNRILPISYSDSVWYLTKSDEIQHIPVFSNIGEQAGVPSYDVSGKPENSELLGIAHQLMYLKDKIGLENIKTILPTATFVAAQLTNKLYWNTWDMTHAANSGMWDYKNARWAPQMHPFIEAGVINNNVVAPRATLHIEPNIAQQWCVGGHDSVFAVANDIPYSTKPYLSLGTWITASVEGWFKQRSKNCPTRFVIAPNGTILEQLCFKANIEEYEKAIAKTIAFFERRLPHNTRPRRINVFGGWSEIGLKLWSKIDGFEFVRKDDDFNDYLHQQAVKYAVSSENTGALQKIT